jgi:hypothetical protein
VHTSVVLTLLQQMNAIIIYCIEPGKILSLLELKHHLEYFSFRSLFFASI